MTAIKITTDRRCPHCQTDHRLNRIHRTWVTRTMLFFLDVRRYHCYECDQVFTQVVRQKQPKKQLVDAL